MGLVTYQIPTVGAASATEDPKVATALAQIAAVLNGGLDATNMAAAFAFPQVVSALPGSPVDGQQIYYLADPANGVVWHLRYRSASGSLFKWEYIGGGELLGTGSAGATQSTANVTTYTAMTGSPIVTLPLAGDYDITLAGDIDSQSAGLVEARVALFAFGSVNLGVFGWLISGTQFEAANAGATRRLVTLPAGEGLSAQVATNNLAAAFGNVMPWTLRVKPVRVG